MNYSSDKGMGEAPQGSKYFCHLPVGYGGCWGRGRTKEEAISNAKKAAKRQGRKVKEFGEPIVTDENTGEEV